MYTKEVNEKSPLRILEQSIHGGLGKGNLGVVMARAGVGKTACMVQIGLDDLMRERGVLHVALGQSLEHVQSWYDALFDDLARVTGLEERDAVYARINRHRIIQAYADHQLSSDRIEKALEVFSSHLRFKPQAILIDGFDWTGPVASTAATIGAFKAFARRLEAELWMSAQTHRHVTGPHPTRITAPCAEYSDLIDVAIFLEPHGPHVQVRLLKDHDNPSVGETHLHLQCDTLRLCCDGEDDHGSDTRFPAHNYTLLSGAAQGAEAEFGACAERFGLHEVNYSFEGHAVARTRGLHSLTDAELRLGDVSSAYLTAHMHRAYPGTPIFKKVLQSIWHQVNTAGEVFVVGNILPDNTVKGGTGWAAELAKHEHKPVRVYDQEKHGWYVWNGTAWAADPAPIITRTRFTGTGTRFLSDDGRAAIRALFERSFGKPTAKS